MGKAIIGIDTVMSIWIGLQRIIIFLVLLCLFGTGHASYAQSQQVKSDADAGERLRAYVKNMDAFNRLFPQEKVYLHFDNTGYYRGETIWFSAYVVRTDKMRYTDMSSVLYVELLNPSGDVVETRKLKIEDGRADGSIKLDNLFTSGFYEVRAYTRYMLNWDSRGVFSRVLPVFNAPLAEGDYSETVIDTYSHRKRLPENRETDTIEHDKRLNVRFFPEGGRLVQGLSSVVAFEVTRRDGESLDAVGYLRYPNGDTTGVSTLREGRGLFNYTPAAIPATFVLRDAKDREREFPLPTADDSGCIMSVNTANDDNIEMYVSRTSDYDEPLAFVLMHNGNVEAFQGVSENKDVSGFSIPKKDMDDGVSVISLLSADGDVVAERCVFIFPRSRVDSISISSLTDEILPCGRIKLEAKSKANTSFSLSVRDYATDRNGSDMNVATWLLLSSELKGYIRNAEYYLESDDEAHRKAADLLMLVQGWSRYDVKQMCGNKEFLKTHPIEDGLLIDGRLRKASKRNTVDGVDVRVALYNSLGESLSATTRTDKDGNYAFRMPDSEGEYTMLLDAKKNGEDLKCHIGINRSFSPLGRHLFPYETRRIDIAQEPLHLSVPNNFDFMIPKSGGIKTGRNRLLREVTVKGRRIYDNARAAWESERQGSSKAVVRYDCMKAADEIADRGDEVPGLFDWLKERNKFFFGSATEMENASIIPDTTANAYSGRTRDMDAKIVVGGIGVGKPILEDPLEDGYMGKSRGSVEMYEEELRIGHKILLQFEGLSYKSRPIVWILNNRFYYLSMAPTSITLEDFPNTDDVHVMCMPEGLDGFKSVYISEDENIWRRYIQVKNLERHSPVTVFVYSSQQFPIKYKGQRQTHFEAYNKKETYEMPDYSVLPPMADHRRTLYWNPNVKIDGDGKAIIELYNNSSCRQIVVSAEGITADGRAVLCK